MRGGGAGAHLGGVVYEPELTLSLPRAETVGTALNALAHSAEALYVEGHNADADEHALTGARLIGEWLRASSTCRRISTHGRSCSRARCTREWRSVARCWRSVTRSRRRSAGATACHTAR